MSKKQKLLIVSALGLILIIIFSILLNRDHKIIESEEYFIIKNTTKKAYIFVYEIDGDETYTSETGIIGPGGAAVIDKINYFRDYYRDDTIKSIKVVGKYQYKNFE